ncbi:predicted protein [Nematostella vectensis]|uniref:Paraoxonase n=2 Tax=Nematostella vectensis TaxID=45351 RepID=A7S5F8_NEMVE|nr:predicted protein [Nematostella vectensis]|eukprot:XP_001633141.1 predicted protein [Nematostella vectensis]
MSLYGFNVTGFNPHGLSLYTDPRTGVVSIFVVNHRPDAQAIEIFDFDQEAVSLVFRRSVWHELIYSPNDVAATGPDSFYVTNDDYHHFDQQFLRMLDMALLGYFLRSGVVYYDGSTSRATHVIGGLQEPNGIAIRDERLVFVNTHEKVKIYRRQKDNELVFAQEIDIGYRLDNVNVDKLTGDLWFSVFPRVLDFLTFSTNLDFQCPSKVVSVKLGKEHAEGDPFPFYDIREVYANNGSEVRGSTSATRHDGKFAVAAIFDKFLICDLGPY